MVRSGVELIEIQASQSSKNNLGGRIGHSIDLRVENACLHGMWRLMMGVKELRTSRGLGNHAKNQVN